MGETRLIQLLDQLNGPDDDDCEVAAIALGKMGEVALPHLAALLANGDADTRFWAVRALQAMGTRAAVEALVDVLDDPEEIVRSGSALALGELKAEIAVDELARMGVGQMVYFRP